MKRSGFISVALCKIKNFNIQSDHFSLLLMIIMGFFAGMGDVYLFVKVARRQLQFLGNRQLTAPFWVHLHHCPHVFFSNLSALWQDAVEGIIIAIL